METMTDFEKRIKAMRLEITAQNKTIDELATSFNHKNSNSFNMTRLLASKHSGQE